MHQKVHVVPLSHSTRLQWLTLSPALTSCRCLKLLRKETASPQICLRQVIAFLSTIRADFSRWTLRLYTLENECLSIAWGFNLPNIKWEIILRGIYYLWSLKHSFVPILKKYFPQTNPYICKWVKQTNQKDLIDITKSLVFFFSFFKSKFWFFPSFLKGLTSTIPGYFKTKEKKGNWLNQKNSIATYLSSNSPVSQSERDLSPVSLPHKSTGLCFQLGLLGWSVLPLTWHHFLEKENSTYSWRPWKYFRLTDAI